MEAKDVCCHGNRLRITWPFFLHSKEAFIKLQTDDMKSDERSLQIKEQEERAENDLLQGPL